MAGMLRHFRFLGKLKIVPRDTSSAGRPPAVLVLAFSFTLVSAATARGADDDAPPPAPEAAQPEGEAAPAAAGGTADAAPAPAAEPGASFLATYYPPPVAGPALRLPESQTRLYIDGAFAQSNDLSALPYIEGSGRNLRFALGGVWRWHRFAFEGEVPFLNVTTINVPTVLNMPTDPADQHQTSFALGDVMVGATWTTQLFGTETLVAGLGLRGRLATHTTRFSFHLADGSLNDFSIPYYFHIEPTAILGGAVGPIVWVVNEGAIALVGPDGNFQDQHITVPTILFWDAHYAIACAPWSFLGASVELVTDWQLNHIPGVDFAKFNGVRAAWVAPALQIHFGDTRVDLIARFGLTRGEELYGVLEYSGTRSYTLRVTRAFN
jgi:hypothetical protein